MHVACWILQTGFISGNTFQPFLRCDLRTPDFPKWQKRPLSSSRARILVSRVVFGAISPETWTDGVKWQTRDSTKLTRDRTHNPANQVFNSDTNMFSMALSHLGVGCSGRRPPPASEAYEGLSSWNMQEAEMGCLCQPLSPHYWKQSLCEWMMGCRNKDKLNYLLTYLPCLAFLP